VNYEEKGTTMRLMRIRNPGLESWGPIGQLTSVRDELNRLFSSTFGELGRPSDLFGMWTPALDLYEGKNEFVVRAELPGMKKEEIEIALHEGALSVSGERKIEELPEESEPHRRERFFGRFQRTLELPKPVKAQDVKATYKDGILTITLPKTEEAKPRQIEVSVE
jgi:HSP20 family protein